MCRLGLDEPREELYEPPFICSWQMSRYRWNFYRADVQAVETMTSPAGLDC
ncbi:MAG: hypothetical protein INR71_04635 [Terriglobus roseus]|nr:hypothetical protein [Terriglobus roseus]